MLYIYRGKHSGSRGHTGKGHTRAAGPALAAIAAAGLCLAAPSAASAAQHPAAAPAAQPPAGTALAWGDIYEGWAPATPPASLPRRRRWTSPRASV